MADILIIIRSEQRGFYVGIGEELVKLGHAITYAVDGKHNLELVRLLYPDHNGQTLLLRDYRKRPTVRKNILVHARAVEEKCDVRIAALLGEDRALGRGYLLNIDKYPSIRRSHWTGVEKIEHMLREIEQAEELFDGHDVVLSQYPEVVQTVVCESLGIHHFHLSQAKFGNRFFWSSDGFQRNPEVERCIDHYLSCEDDNTDLDPPYAKDSIGQKLIDQARYSRRFVIGRVLSIIFRDTFNLVTRRRKAESYRPYGWILPTIAKRSNYLFVKRHSTSIRVAEDGPIFYFPLHVEPEVSLLRLAPEFSNTMEAIVWVSKALPVGSFLAVKEQPNAFGVRSRLFYERLAVIHNIVLVPPEDDSWDWLKAATAVVAFTGTVGFEAVHFEKPVISLGQHQLINRLPTVYVVSNYLETKAAIDRILDRTNRRYLFAKSRIALHRAQIETSFEMPELAFSRKRMQLSKETLEVGAKTLHHSITAVLSRPQIEREYLRNKIQ